MENSTENTNSHHNQAHEPGADREPFDPARMTPGRWLRIAAKRKRAMTREYYRSLDATAREGISDEDYATTMATLETMARNLGWDENQGMPGHGGWRARGPRRGFGPGFGPGFGRGFGPGFGPGHDHGQRHGHPHEHGRQHGHENSPS